MKPETFKAYGYEVILFPLGGSYHWNLTSGGSIFKQGSARSRKLAIYRAREAARLQVEG